MLTLTDSTGAVFDALTAELSMPERGNWVARVEFGDDAAPVVGSAILTLQRDGDAGSDTFTGFVRYGGSWQGRSEVQMVGGAGGLLTELPPRHYAPRTHRIDAMLLVEHIVRDAGEVLDPSSSVDGAVVGQWTRLASTARRALSLLCDRLDLQWRVLDTGAIWIGDDAHPVATDADVGYQTTDRPEARVLELRPDRATLRPGMVVLGQTITRIVYQLTASGVSARAYYGPADRIELADVAAGLGPDSRYARTYGATALSPASGGMLEVLVDDTAVGTLRRVPIRTGLLGARGVVAAGERVRVSFEGAEPDGAFVATFDEPAAAVANKAIARVGDTIDCGWFTVAPGLAPGSFVLAPAAPGAGDATHITGTITSGSAEVFVR